MMGSFTTGRVPSDTFPCIEDLTGDLLHPVGGDAIDPLDRLCRRDRGRPEDLLWRQLPGPRARAFRGIEQPGAYLMARGSPHPR